MPLMQAATTTTHYLKIISQPPPFKSIGVDQDSRKINQKESHTHYHAPPQRLMHQSTCLMPSDTPPNLPTF